MNPFAYQYPGFGDGCELRYESVSAYSDHDFVRLLQPEETPLVYDDYLNLPSTSNARYGPDHKKGAPNMNRTFEGENECSDALRYISKTLMDDDLEDVSCSIHDSALHAAELNFSELLNGASPSSSNHGNKRANPDYSIICGANSSRGRSPYQEDETRNAKHLAVYADETILHELFDKVLSLQVKNDGAPPKRAVEKEWKLNELPKGLYRELSYPKKGDTKQKKTADMRTLLLRSMQSVAENDHGSATKLLGQIRSRSSPSGDATQRVAHYFANSLEARMVGAGSKKHKTLADRSMSDPSVLKALTMLLSLFPFVQIAHSFAVETIMDQAAEASSLHIIHFGIMYGVAWAPLIQRLSTRPGGPPKLVITGLDLVQAGLQPYARVKEAGRLLTECCQNFKVPFEYNAIAKNWETISIRDFKIDKNCEMVVVDCQYLSMYTRDDTMMEHSQRDAVLRLIYEMSPDICFHGGVNGAHNSPFFVSRSRDALFYYSALFDMLEANLDRDDQDRIVFEREVLGKNILNVIACEGLERVERPETYRTWQIRAAKAGFKQLPLNQDIMKKVKSKVKESSYHKDFYVDEASDWLLIGWKGRVLNAHSCWKPG